MSSDNLSSSFRDPSGFLFRRDGLLYRQINDVYRENYDLLMGGGLYDELGRERLLLPHEEVAVRPASPDEAYRIIKPEPVEFISYPYEWSFSQLKDAALTTLEIQKRALASGMSLKDASAYNIQYHNGRWVLIDTLSFEKYEEGQPWVAYRQFCQHFLAPLALMAHKDIRLGQLLRVYIDGVPLDLCSALLPWRTRLKPALLTHIHLHAASQKRYADKPVGRRGAARGKMSRRAFCAFIDHLESAASKLDWKPGGTEWADYYEFTNYSDDALRQKGRLVEEFLQAGAPRSVWDLGANTGFFSQIPARKRIPTLAFDIDPAAVERNYRECRQRGETCMLPLLLDLTNPSPPLGWEHRERMSLMERGPADLALALALVHHLAISNNVPLPRLAAFFHRLCRMLIIEFVPKSDSKVQKLLATREDVFPSYHQDGFEKAFGSRFIIEKAERLPGSERTIYLMRAREADQ